jgi:restriction system protein
LTPTEYEHHVADLLRAEGWDARVTPPSHDFGLDIICERPGRRLGVQVKMYGAGRPINTQMVMQLHGAAAYQDCPDMMIATNGRVLDDARRVAKKVGVEIRYVPVSAPGARRVSRGHGERTALDFDRVWEEQVMPLAGQVLTRSNGTTNEILAVDWTGITRRTSNGSIGTIDIEIFRWTVERLLRGEVVLREGVNDQYPKRASSGVMLVLSALPPFATVKVGGRTGLRMRERDE